MLIDRYLARLMLRPFLICLALTAMLLLIDRLRRLLDFVVQFGGPIPLVWRMLLNTVPSYLSYGLTLGLLLAVMLAVRRLALGEELDVLRGCGVSYRRLLRVPYLYALVLAAANFGVVMFVQPHARYVNERLQYELRSGALGAIVRAHDFAPLGPGSTMRVERVDADHRMEGVFIRSRRPDGTEVTISAERADVMAAPDADALTFHLVHGSTVTRTPGRPPNPQPDTRVLTFASHDLEVPLPRIDSFRDRGTGRAEELTLPELMATARDNPRHTKPHRQARAELHFRLAEVAAMLVLPALALGLAVPPKRSRSALGLVLAIPLVVFWFKVNGWGASAAAAGRIDAVPALWGPFVAVAALAWWMVRRLDRTPGGAPIARLERGWAYLTARWRRRPVSG